MKSIEEIVEGCIKNNSLCQMEFYDQNFSWLLVVVGRIVGRCDEAEDIVQESFIKLFERIEKYKDAPKSAIYALRRIAINASIDCLRRRHVKFVDEDKADDLIVIENDDLERFDFKVEQVKRAIDVLPQGYRLIVTLRAVEQMEFEEIAKQLHITPSTVRSQYVRAKSKIVKMIEDEKG